MISNNSRKLQEKQASLSGRSRIWGTIFFFFFFEVLVLLDLDVPSCNLVQYQGKLMKQPLKNDQKKSNFRHNFGPFGPNLGSQRFFSAFTPTNS